MHALARQGVQERRHGRDQRLAFAGLQLGDAAVVDRDAADDLHVELALADRALGGLAHQGERLDQQAVERIALPGPQSQAVGTGLQLFGDSGPRERLERVDAIDQHGITAQPAGMGRPGQLLNSIQPRWAKATGHGVSFSSSVWHHDESPGTALFHQIDRAERRAEPFPSNGTRSRRLSEPNAVTSALRRFQTSHEFPDNSPKSANPNPNPNRRHRFRRAEEKRGRDPEGTRLFAMAVVIAEARSFRRAVGLPDSRSEPLGRWCTSVWRRRTERRLWKTPSNPSDEKSSLGGFSPRRSIAHFSSAFGVSGRSDPGASPQKIAASSALIRKEAAAIGR